MKDAKLHPLAVLIFASILFAVSGCVWAQATPPSLQRPSAAEQSKSAPPATEATPSPAIDPDVKQWFLERMRQRRPYDPKDVEVLTGRARDLEQEREAQYRWNSWTPYALGAGTPYGGRWNAFDRPGFARPEFFFFGHSHFGLEGFFFGRPFFGAGGHRGSFGAPWGWHR